MCKSLEIPTYRKDAFTFCYKFYFSFNISTLILMIIYHIYINPFKDPTIKDCIHNWKLSPIYDIYITDEKTSESIQFGELEKYSDDDLYIKSTDIYKWKNKYLNVKRLDTKIKDLDEKDYNSSNTKPINYLKIDNRPYSDLSNSKTIKIDDNNYLHYTNDNSLSVLVDLKISNKSPFTHCEEEKNICFLYYCSVFENKNEGKREIIDIDSSDNFIKYNNIEIEIKNKNSFGFYKPESFQLYEIDNILEKKNVMNNIITMEALDISFIVINIFLRIIRFICFYFIKRLYKVSICECDCKGEEHHFSFFNIILAIIQVINLAIIIYFYSLFSEIKSTYALTESVEIFDDSDFFNYLKALIYIEFINLFFILISDFKYYFSEYDYLTSYIDCSNILIPCLYKKKEKKYDILYNELIVNKKALNEKLEEFENLDNKIRITPNSIELKEIRYNNLKSKLNSEKEDELSRLNEILKCRDKVIEDLKASINIQKDLKINIEKNLKLDINCIYFDTTIDGGNESSNGYIFFKFLKNSIKGLFFGIKSEDDLINLLSELGKNFKFVLIIKGSEEDKDLIQGYSDYFSDIIVFSVKSPETKELLKINNVSIEDTYLDIIKKLEKIHESKKQIYDINLMKQYKPYKLALYSDYEIYKYKICHRKLLENTILKKDIENIQEEEFYKGLSENEYNEFISFINNLEEIKDGEKIDTPLNDENIFEKTLKDDNSILSNSKSIDIKEKNIIENENDNINEIITTTEPLIPDNYKNIRENEPLLDNDNENDNELIRDNQNSYLNRNNNRENNRIIKINRNHEDDIIKVDNKINNDKNLLGKIEKTRKQKIKDFFIKKGYNYKDSRYLARLYTSDEEKFYKYINNWLLTLNQEIFEKISPITGKIINILYQQISAKSKKLNNDTNMKLYRGFSIKKTDIFLYKACEGDIMCYPSFLSMTTDKTVAKNFIKDDDEITDLKKMCSCLIKLDYNIKEGCKEQGADISSYSNYDEKEILFPPFSFFKIEKVKCDKNKHEGTKKNPFKINLKIINRDFYLDRAIFEKKDFIYDRKNNIWVLKEEIKDDNNDSNLLISNS